MSFGENTETPKTRCPDRDEEKQDEEDDVPGLCMFA